MKTYEDINNSELRSLVRERRLINIGNKFAVIDLIFSMTREELIEILKDSDIVE